MLYVARYKLCSCIICWFKRSYELPFLWCMQLGLVLKEIAGLCQGYIMSRGSRSYFEVPPKQILQGSQNCHPLVTCGPLGQLFLTFSLLPSIYTFLAGGNAVHNTCSGEYRVRECSGFARRCGCVCVGHTASLELLGLLGLSCNEWVRTVVLTPLAPGPTF